MTTPKLSIVGGNSSRGGGGEDGGMEIGERVAALEAKQDSLATKADLADAKVDLIKWVVATGVVIIFGMVGGFFAVLNRISPSATPPASPPQLQPIIIQVPTPRTVEEAPRPEPIPSPRKPK